MADGEARSSGSTSRSRVTSSQVSNTSARRPTRQQPLVLAERPRQRHPLVVWHLTWQLARYLDGSALLHVGRPPRPRLRVAAALV